MVDYNRFGSEPDPNRAKKPLHLVWIAVIVMGIGFLFVSLPRSDSHRNEYRRDVEAATIEHAKPVSETILHLAQPYLTEESHSGFKQSINDQKNLVEHHRLINSYIVEAALPSIEREWDERQKMMMELDIAYRHMVNFRQLNETSWDSILLRQRYEQFRKAKADLEAALAEAKQHYSSPEK